MKDEEMLMMTEVIDGVIKHQNNILDMIEKIIERMDMLEMKVDKVVLRCMMDDMK